MNLYNEEAVVGDIVEVIDENEYYRMNTTHRYRLQPGDQLEVRQVFHESVNVRTVLAKYNRWTGRNEHMSFSLNKAQVRLLNPDRPLPRKLGQKPDDPNLIDVNDPRIQWLFDDMGAYADNQGWCPQYDTLCVRLGIPGRPRDFEVKRTIGGIELRTTVKARSQREANELVDAALNVPAQGPVETESGTV
jgi:hypothetical protein